MKNPSGRYYFEVNDKRYITHPNEDIILREQKRPKNLRTQNQLQNDITFRRNQKALQNDNIELEVKHYPKRKSNEKQNCKNQNLIMNVLKVSNDLGLKLIWDNIVKTLILKLLNKNIK